MCYKCLASESKMVFILNVIVGSSVGCLLNCRLFPYLKVMGCPLSCPLTCQLYLYMEVVGSLICMAKFPWAARGAPPLFFQYGIGTNCIETMPKWQVPNSTKNVERFCGFSNYHRSFIKDCPQISAPL